MEPNEDLRLVIGGRGEEYEIPSYIESPSWIVDGMWDSISEIAQNSLAAYMAYVKELGLPQSLFLGLDILVTGVSDGEGNKLVDLRPTILEGPCCNSYPACPNFWAKRLYKILKRSGKDPDAVEYPTHPEKILEKIVQTFLDTWKARGGEGDPIVGVFTRPYEVSEEEAAHLEVIGAFDQAGIEVHRITPVENPEVKDGKLWVDGVSLDMIYRRIERVHMPEFYGDDLARRIVEETPDTITINPWAIDDLRSKTKEEDCFRRWEKATGGTVSRPRTLLADEITSESVRDLARTGGFAMKRWNSTGGNGVFLHFVAERLGKIPDWLYRRYDGRHIEVLDPEAFERMLEDTFTDFTEDTAIQELRLIDARDLPGERKLVYDTRINVLYNELRNEWDYLSGISRVVACGESVEKGNSLLTNITAGAEIAPLVMGHTKSGRDRSEMSFGPMCQALMDGKTEITLD